MTPAQLHEFAVASDRFYDGLSACQTRFGINTTTRLCAFLAQVAHESGGFRFVRENLNYSAKALRATWPKRFDAVRAAEYERKPEKIAAYVYANRMGNGDEASGDGATYIGRGLIQCTGLANYSNCSTALFGDDRLIHRPELLEEPTNAALSAGWFWMANGCNQIADAGDFEALTRRINGGTHGLEDRRQWWAKAKRIFVNH